MVTFPKLSPKEPGEIKMLELPYQIFQKYMTVRFKLLLTR